jgi:hypothetical protein
MAYQGNLIQSFWKQWPDYKIKIFAGLERRRLQMLNQNMEESAITLPEGKQLIQIFPSEIIAVKTGEKRQGNSHIFKSDNQLLCSLPLSQVMEKLPKYFFLSRYPDLNDQFKTNRHVQTIGPGVNHEDKL